MEDLGSIALTNAPADVTIGDMNVTSGDIEAQEIRIRCRDGVQLAADLYQPRGAVRATVLIAPAMGVRRDLYGKYAAFLARAGLLTLVPDYRGIGGSKAGPLRGFETNLVDWAQLDLAACVQDLRRRVPGAPLLWVGHSLGGHLLALQDHAEIRAAMLISSGSGWAGHWDGLAGLGMRALWAAIPVLGPIFGHLPMSRFGGGEDVPRGAAEQWARWGRDPDYILAHVRRTLGVDSFLYFGPLRAYTLTDDPYVPAASARALFDAYARADRELKVLNPSDLGVRRVGHFRLFLPTFKDTFWTESRQWLLGHALPGKAAPISFAEAAVASLHAVPAVPKSGGSAAWIR